MIERIRLVLGYYAVVIWGVIGVPLLGYSALAMPAVFNYFF